MRITGIQYYIYQIPFRQGLATAHGVIEIREGVILEVHTDSDMMGIGEIAPLPMFAGPDLNEVLAELRLSSFVHKVKGQTPAIALNTLYQEAGQLPASAICGIEIALLDILSRCRAQPLWSMLDHLSFSHKYPEFIHDRHMVHTLHSQNGATPQAGDHKGSPLPNCTSTQEIPTTRRIPVNAIIGAATIEGALHQTHNAIATGFRCLKLKMGIDPHTDLQRLMAIRSLAGDSVTLRLDANEAWDFETAHAILQNCSAYNIQYVEQPLPAHDLAGMKRLRQLISVPIAADEAVSDFASAQHILHTGTADLLILKPQLVGGLARTRQIIQQALKHGVQCVITSALETGIGLTAIAQLVAGSPEITLESGLATAHLLVDDLLDQELTIKDGFLYVPTQPGLGVSLDRDALAHYTISRGWL